MPTTDEPLPLDYTDQWLALGIVTLEDIHRDVLLCATSDDSYPEHYRWRAFSRFMAALPSLTPSLAHQLYALGDADADRAMGGSTMAAILRHKDCPADLLESALASDRSHLPEIANRRLNRD